MKTHTHTRTTYTIPGTEIEVELPIMPDDIMLYKEPLVRITEDKIVLGYLAHDEHCENPLENGAGHIYDCRRHSRTLDDYCAALGLRRDGGGLDLELVPEEDVVKECLRRIEADPELFSKALAHCYDHWEPKGQDEETDAEFVGRCLDSIDELTPILDVGAVNLEMWHAGRKNGTIGNPYAVMLDVYEHGGIAYSLSGDGMQCQWDTARAAAVWVPSKALIPEIEIHADAETRANRARELAKEAADQCTDWCNGNCFSIVVVTYDKAGNETDHDICSGFVGDDYAYKALCNDYFPKGD